MTRALVGLLAAAPLAAQEPTGLEAGPLGGAIAARRDFVGGGVAIGLRPGGGVRVVLAGLAGGAGGGFAVRGEVVGHLMLTPARRRGLGLYGLGGVAGTAGPTDRADLVLGLGVETAPAGPWGVALEGGVGGGARLLIAIRRRWLGTRPR